MSAASRRLYELIPELYRVRDAAQGGPLEALITVATEQVAAIEANLEQLYDDQFIETCDDWVVPYIGDLLGLRQLHGSVPDIASPRAEVANTIAYRRRKGTATVLEQLARDVTGWNARVVESFQLLAATQYMNHVRPNNGYAPSMRDWAPLERLGGPFNTLAHTIDVRSPLTQSGRFNIPNLCIFLWRLGAYSLTRSPAPTLDGRRFFFSPLARNTRLYTKPEAEHEITHLAEPINVPEPLSRNVLDANRNLYFGPHKSLNVWVNGSSLSETDVDICNLVDHAGTWAHLPVNRVAVDPVLGRIAIPEALAGNNDKQAIVITGFSGGSYALEIGGQQTPALDTDATTAEVQAALEALVAIGPGNVLVTGTVSASAIDLEVELVGSLSGSSLTPIVVDTAAMTGAPNANVSQSQAAAPGALVEVLFHCGFSAEMGGGEYERGTSLSSDIAPLVSVSGGSPVQPALDSVQPGGVVQLEDSGRYVGALSINVAQDARVELSSANEHRATVDAASLEIVGGSQSTVVINGLLLTGGPLVVAAGNNELKRLILRHCTLVPGRRLSAQGEPLEPDEPSVIVETANVNVELERCIVGSIRVNEDATVSIRDSIVDATDPSGVAYSGSDGAGPGAPLEIRDTSVIGKVHTRELSLASNVVFHSRLADAGETWIAPVLSVKKQAGCVRFSYIPVGSRVPRRFRCQPDLAVRKALAAAAESGASLSDTEKQSIAALVHARVRPSFTSRRYGGAGYAQLSRACPLEIQTGADDEAEMGAFHDLYQPQREANLRLRLDEYVRFGLEAGIFYVS